MTTIVYLFCFIFFIILMSKALIMKGVVRANAVTHRLSLAGTPPLPFIHTEQQRSHRPFADRIGAAVDDRGVVSRSGDKGGVNVSPTRKATTTRSWSKGGCAESDPRAANGPTGDGRLTTSQMHGETESKLGDLAGSTDTLHHFECFHRREPASTHVTHSTASSVSASRGSESHPLHSTASSVPGVMKG